MFHMKVKTLSVAAVLGLAACASQGPGYQINSATGLTPAGSDFNKALYGYYLGRSANENAENDYANSDLFAIKAKNAASGVMVLPEVVGVHTIPADKVAEMEDARQCLVLSLDRGGRSNVPDTAALAQLKFDCWMEEQEENIQPRDIAECRGEFYDALAKFRDCEEEVMMPAPMPAPAPAMPQRAVYIVYFDFNSAEVDHGGSLITQAVSEDVDALGGATVEIFGHTDLSGDLAYNQNLSRQRAEAVRQALLSLGLEARVISSSEYGETRPQRPTDDGVRHPLNRRVEIIVNP